MISKLTLEQLELVVHNKRVYGLKVEQDLLDRLDELRNQAADLDAQDDKWGDYKV